ncbi:MAG: hypothetical protein H6835_05855 [Planctomycetes bacterium]|nr:hypothetical protein [Planctomycetota bacterium]
MNTRTILSFALTAGLAAAQCPFSNFSVTVAGSGCNPVVASATTPIVAAASFASCSLQIGTSVLVASDSVPLLRILVLGFSDVYMPMPQLGPGCVLIPQPDFMVMEPVMTPMHLVVVPAGLQMPVSLTAQGAVLYVGSITGPYEWAVSDALRLTLQ